jgi:hypothetical protein
MKNVQINGALLANVPKSNPKIDPILRVKLKTVGVFG